MMQAVPKQGEEGKTSQLISHQGAVTPPDGDVTRHAIVYIERYMLLQDRALTLAQTKG
jgi:hypothetical protein